MHTSPTIPIEQHRSPRSQPTNGVPVVTIRVSYRYFQYGNGSEHEQWLTNAPVLSIANTMYEEEND